MTDGSPEADSERRVMELWPWTVASALLLLFLVQDVDGEQLVAFASWDPDVGVNVSVVPSLLHVPDNYAANAVYNNSINITGSVNQFTTNSKPLFTVLL